MSKEQQELVAPEVMDAVELDAVLTGTGVVKVEPDGRVVHVPRDLTPASMLAEVVQRNPTPEVLEKMIALHERWEARQAKKAYVAAMSAFKQDCPPVIAKTKKATFNTNAGQGVNYNWTPLEDIVSTATPHLSKHGLSMAHDRFEQNDKGVRVTCTISHRDGHSESVSLAAQLKENRLLSPAQVLMVTVTQLKRHTAMSILGLATVDLADEETAAAQHLRKVSGRASKEQLAELKQLLQQVGPALAKKHKQALELAQRGTHINLEPVFEELYAALEPPKEK